MASIAKIIDDSLNSLQVDQIEQSKIKLHNRGWGHCTLH